MAAENASGPPVPPSGTHAPQVTDAADTIIVPTGGADQSIAPASAQESEGRP
jgi:hypothetical protein